MIMLCFFNADVMIMLCFLNILIDDIYYGDELPLSQMVHRRRIVETQEGVYEESEYSKQRDTLYFQ